MATQTCEIWLVIDSDGDWVVNGDGHAEALAAYAKAFGNPVEDRSVIKLVVEDVPIPQPRSIVVSLPAEVQKEERIAIRELDVS